MTAPPPTTTTTTTNPGLTILTNLLQEFAARLSIDGSSRLLVTDPTVARHLVGMTREIATAYGPKFTLAVAGEPHPSTGSVEALGPNVSAERIEDLTGKMDHFTHAVADVSLASGKTCMEIVKWAKYALQPKGILVVVAMKRMGGGEGEDGEGGLELGERLRRESKGRVGGLGDVLEFAGFERGKIRVMERSVKVEGGKEVEAEVVLAMKWDQLTA